MAASPPSVSVPAALRASSPRHNPTAAAYPRRLSGSRLSDWSWGTSSFPLRHQGKKGEKNITKQNPAHSLWDTPTAPPPLPPTSLPGPSLPAHSGIKTTYCLSTIGVKDFLPSHGRRPGPTELQGGNLNSASALRCFLLCIVSYCQARWINDRQITPCDVRNLLAAQWMNCCPLNITASCNWLCCRQLHFPWMFCGRRQEEPALRKQSKAIQMVVVVVEMGIRLRGRACRQTGITSFPIQWDAGESVHLHSTDATPTPSMQSNLVDSVKRGTHLLPTPPPLLLQPPLFFLFLLRIDVEKVLWRALAMVAGSNNGSRLLPFEGVTILPGTALNNAPLATKAENVT